jgi:TPP-dependent pyruvate/acetoin dehydrogenase alpha subunit
MSYHPRARQEKLCFSKFAVDKYVKQKKSASNAKMRSKPSRVKLEGEKTLKALSSDNWWSDAQEADLRDTERLSVQQALEAAFPICPPSVAELFSDVYDVIPPHLKPERELHEHMEVS